MELLKIKLEDDTWVDIPALQGPPGPEGPRGQKGDPGESYDEEELNAVKATAEDALDATADIINNMIKVSDEQPLSETNHLYISEEENILRIPEEEDINQIKENLDNKLTEPSNMAVGKYFKIAAIDENGHAVLEAVDVPSGGVSDVQLNGKSVVTDGVATIPFAGNANTDYGVVTAYATYGIQLWSKTHPLVHIARASDHEVKNPVGATMIYKPIVAATEHAAAFYGLAKAAGDTTQATSSNAVGQYTPEAQAAIQQMIGFQTITQEEYDLLETKDASTYYFIVDGDTT